MLRLRKIFGNTSIGMILAATLSCSGLLYYPDHVMYVEEEFMQFKPADTVLKIKSGGEIHGWYFSAPSKPKAVIVFFHGNGQNRTSHIVDVYWLIKEGYDIFALEYPGYGETDGSPTPENTVESGHAALKYVAEKNPGLPIIVYGQSLGGAVALRTVIDMKKEIPISMVVVQGTFTSYKRVAKKVMARSWITWPIQWLGPAVLSDEFAPGDRVKELAPIPLVILHDRFDPVVPYAMGEELFAKASEPKEFWTLETHRHDQPFGGETGPEMRRKFLNRLSAGRSLSQAK
jgi:pimeloyl-ACP methyl ester carboxylesterase